MTLKDLLLDVKDTSFDDLLARLNLRRAPRGASRFALPAMALAGAAAVGWLARAFHAPTAGRMQRRPPREGASANRGTKIKAVSKVRGLLPEPSTRTAGSSTGAKTKARRNARELKERLER